MKILLLISREDEKTTLIELENITELTIINELYETEPVDGYKTHEYTGNMNIQIEGHKVK